MVLPIFGWDSFVDPYVPGQIVSKYGMTLQISTNRQDDWLNCLPSVSGVGEASSLLICSYIWCLDLIATMDGAGCVGGLLWICNFQSSSGAHFAAYDGNGNVVALVSATTGAETARYEYGPFAEPICVTGPAANLNPFRFSTKRTCNTTDLVLYEYRAYSPSLGRWANRDPLGEPGFEVARRGRTKLVGDASNLSAFICNDPVDRTDVLRLYGASIDNAIRTCMARPTIYLQLECLDDLLDTLGADFDDLARKKIVHVRNCAVTHAVYTAAEKEGEGCRPGLTCGEYKKKVAAISLEVAGRAKYLGMKCDYCLPGSIARDSKRAEKGHIEQLVQKTGYLGTCTALMNAACGEK